MKKTLSVLICSFITACSFGQFYIQPYAGYTFSSHPKEIQSLLIINNYETSYRTKLKLGEGINVGINSGYEIMNGLSIEINTQKTIYSKYNVSTNQPDLQSLNSFSASGFFGRIDYENSILQINPLIGYRVKKEKFSTYFKLGPNIMKSTINQTLEYTDWELVNGKFNPLYTLEKYEYSGKFHIGLQANLGFCYSIRQNLQLVFDLVTVYNNYLITKEELKYKEIDGVSQKIEDSNIEINKDNNKINFSQYGVNIGLKYVFNKKE